MNKTLALIVTLALCEGFASNVMAETQADSRLAEWFAARARGFVSRKPARDWEHSLLTGNGTMGAMVPGEPCKETIHLSHAALYLPKEDSGAITLAELTWDGANAKAVLIADKDQTVTVFTPAGQKKQCVLPAGTPTEVKL
jgi:hypothetical protein